MVVRIHRSEPRHETLSPGCESDDRLPKYVERVPPPAEVDLVFYEPSVGHIAVAPLGFVHHEDARIVGTASVGLEREHVYVHLGDAIITYPDGTIVVKSRDEALAYFEPKREPELPALPEKIEEIDIDELLAE